MDNTIYRLENLKHKYCNQYLEAIFGITCDDWIKINKICKKHIEKDFGFNPLNNIAQFAKKIRTIEPKIEDAIEANPIIKMIDEILSCLEYLKERGRLNDEQEDFYRNLWGERYWRSQGRGQTNYSDAFIQKEYEKIKETPETERAYRLYRDVIKW